MNSNMPWQKRFQFTLADWLLAAGLAGAAVFLCFDTVLTAIARPVYFNCRPEHRFEVYSLAAIGGSLALLVGFTYAGWFAGVLAANVRGLTGIARWTRLCTGTLAAWFVLHGAIHSAPFAYAGNDPGQNERDAMALCRTYVAAQKEYWRMDADEDDILEFAGSISELARVGLVDAGFAAAELNDGRAVAKGGYVFKLLTGKSSKGQNGEFIISTFNGHSPMPHGFAILAAPVEYGVTGKNTILLNYDGDLITEDQRGQTHSNFIERVDCVRWFYPDTSWCAAE